jgi:hypothetical protein
MSPKELEDELVDAEEAVEDEVALLDISSALFEASVFSSDCRLRAAPRVAQKSMAVEFKKLCPPSGLQEAESARRKETVRPVVLRYQLCDAFGTFLYYTGLLFLFQQCKNEACCSVIPQVVGSGPVVSLEPPLQALMYNENSIESRKHFQSRTNFACNGGCPVVARGTVSNTVARATSIPNM